LLFLVVQLPRFLLFFHRHPLCYLLEQLLILGSLFNFLRQCLFGLLVTGLKLDDLILQFHHLAVGLLFHEALHHFGGRQPRKLAPRINSGQLTLHHRFLKLVDHVACIFHLFFLRAVYLFQAVAQAEAISHAGEC
jgi:hypothetical protein